MSLTDAQLAVRRDCIGSSEIPAIAGLVPWRPPMRLFLERTGQLPREPGNLRTRIGEALEPVIAGEYASRTGVEIALPQHAWPASVDGSLRHPSLPWVLATPDRGVVQHGRLVRLLEIKSVAQHMASHWGDTIDAVPEYVAAQVQWQLEVTQLDEADIAALIGNDLRIYRLRRDPEFAQNLIVIGEAFLHSVRANEPPDFDGTEWTAEYLQKRYPNPRDGLRTWTAEALQLADRIAEQARAIKDAQAALERDRNLLRALIGDSKGFEGGDRRATWTTGRATVRWKAIAEAVGATPELIKQHTTAGTRVLRLAGFNDEETDDGN